LTGHQTAFEIDGGEIARDHDGPFLPKPLAFPRIGPAGSWRNSLFLGSIAP